MATITELNPEIAKKILVEASEEGLPVEVYLKKFIETEEITDTADERLKIMQEAMQDELFLADLEEIAEDFHHTDLE